MKTRMLIVGIVLAALLVTVSSASAATISTDKMDYEPGEVVKISGTGFLVNTTLIQIDIIRPDRTDSCPNEKCIDTLPTTDPNGAFSDYIYDLNGVEGDYIVVVSDGTNTANTTFTDVVTYTLDFRSYINCDFI